MKRLIILLLFAVISGIAAQDNAIHPVDASFIAELEAFIQDEMDYYHVPGAAVAIVMDGEMVYAQGFGMRAGPGSDPVTPETVFSLASMTKSMSALMVATLIDEGRLTWDTPVVDIMTQFALSDAEATSQITLRHLFGHTSGLPEFNYLVWGGGLTPQQYVQFISTMPLAYVPGEDYIYHNQMFSIGAYVGVMASGYTFEDDLLEGYKTLMQERVFDPIGMSSTSLSPAETQANPNHATPMDYTLLGDDPVFFEGKFYNESTDAPSGLAQSNVLDMSRYLLTLLADGIAPDGTRVVSAENLQQLWTTNFENTFYGSLFDTGGYGMGWNVLTFRDIRVMTHGGGVPGVATTMAVLPDADAGIVILSNSAYGRFSESVQYQFIEMLHGLDPLYAEARREEWTGNLQNIHQLFSGLTAPDLIVVTPYVGSYDVGIGNPLQIELRGDQLWLVRGDIEMQFMAKRSGVYTAINGMASGQTVTFSDINGTVNLVFGDFPLPKIG